MTPATASAPLKRAIDILETFEPALPSLLESRALQQRVDRKYVLAPDMAACILAQLWSTYHVVRTRGAVAARYESVYFDTDERRCYYDHYRGRLPRHKIRIRRHLDRQLAFLEVKRKERSGRTVKARLHVPFDREELGCVEREFVEAYAPIDAGSLKPRLAIWFLRTTLVGAGLDERLTFDWDIQFGNAVKSSGMPGVAIAELKQPRYSQRSPAVEAFRGLHLREYGLSKFCLATTQLAQVRGNTFKPALRVLEKLSRCENC